MRCRRRRFRLRCQITSSAFLLCFELERAVCKFNEKFDVARRGRNFQKDFAAFRMVISKEIIDCDNDVVVVVEGSDCINAEKGSAANQ